MRGINRQAIFTESDDYLKFQTIVSNAKEKSGFELYGYCLLSNHCHLLLKAQNEGIGHSIKRIATAYAGWFNWKYDRVGHLFQDRFGSEAVETDEYLLAALRYIHQNPVKARICKSPEHYEWSSYHDYLGSAQGLTDTAFVTGLASSYSKDWKSWFVEFTNADNKDSFIDLATQLKLSDDSLRLRIAEQFDLKVATDLNMLDKMQRDSAVQILKEEGFGLRQITRVTGIPYGIVRGL